MNFFKFFEMKIFKLSTAGKKSAPSVNEVARLLGI